MIVGRSKAFKINSLIEYVSMNECISYMNYV